MSNIPYGRMRLRILADHLKLIGHGAEATTIVNIVVHDLTRRRKLRMTPRKSRKVTPEVRKEVLRLVVEFPRMSQAEIGRRCDISAGRVSEIIHGDR